MLCKIIHLLSRNLAEGCYLLWEVEALVRLQHKHQDHQGPLSASKKVNKALSKHSKVKEFLLAVIHLPQLFLLQDLLNQLLQPLLNNREISLQFQQLFNKEKQKELQDKHLI